MKRRIIYALIWLLAKLDPTIVVTVPALPLALRQVYSITREIDKPNSNDVVVLAALGGVGYFANGYFHPNYWHPDYWAEAGAAVIGTAPRTMGIVPIYITALDYNGRMPVRYVDWGTEQSVPVETLGALADGVVPAYISTDANAVPVSEVEAA